MSAENTPGAVSYPDDYAAFEALMQPGKTAAPGEEAVEQETTSEDSEETPESRTAGESETPDDTEQDEESEPAKPGKRGLEKRFKELTSQVRELKQQLAAKADPGVASPKAEDKAPAGKPKSGDFEDYDDYTESLADWKLEQKLAERGRAEEQSKAEAEFQSVVKTFESRTEAFRENHADYDEALESVDDIEFSHELRDVLLTHEKGPEIAYQLAKNRAESERISKLPPKAQVFEIGQLVAKLSTPAAAPKPQPKASSAPEPIEPSSRPSATRAVRFDDPNVEFASFEKTMNRRQAGR